MLGDYRTAMVVVVLVVVVDLKFLPLVVPEWDLKPQGLDRCHHDQDGW